ncbi:nuclear RNA export factor, partial [Phenoliferia sp. Uapishka_3]
MQPAAAAAIFQAALPKEASGSNDGLGSAIRGRGGPRGRGSRGRGGGRSSVRDEDVGMSDASEGGAKRRGRPSARPGPMGDRPLMRVDGKPYDPRARGSTARNAPATIREEHTRSKSSPASSGNTTSTSGVPTAGAIDTLRLFLKTRYTPEIKMLNLESMATDTVIVGAGLKAPGEKGAPASLSPALWKLAGELFPECISLSLANNHFTSMLPLSPFYLTTSLPNLQNVSLAGNNLSRLRDLDAFSPTFGVPRGDKKQKGWKNLTELVLTGNPMVGEGEAQERYRIEIARRFPTLKVLDQQPIDANIAFAASHAVSSVPDRNPGLSSVAKKEAARAAKAAQVNIIFPVPISGGFFESDTTRDFVAGFFTKFFPAFDSDRPSLLAVYSPICTFSFQVDTFVPFRTRAKKIGSHSDKKFPNQHKLTWTEYLGGGRNLSRVTGSGKRVANLHLDPESVIAKLRLIPKTIHPLTDAEKFVFDAWTMPGLLAPTEAGAPGETVIFASVHGEFMELPSKGVRSFDRTFILAPAPPGSPAQLAGWPCVILSDSLSVRGYTDPNTWAPAPPPAPVPPLQAPSVPVPNVGIAPPPSILQERADGLTDQQQQIVLELQSVTRLTYTFAHMCLVQNGWDPAVALGNFQALHAAGSIPPEAFVA